MPTCAACPMRPQAMKRGRSSRFGQLRRNLPRNTIASSTKPSSVSTAKRRNMKAPTPMCSSTYFTKTKFMPQATIVAIAAARDQLSFFTLPESKIQAAMKIETPPLLSHFARAAVRSLTAPKIRELVNEGLDNPDVLPFWVGEPDQPTPQFIRQAGIDSIQAGEVFYTHNLGIPELREAVAGYLSRLHRKTSFEEVAITSSGVNALMLASQLLVEPGDRVVEVVPLWPNLVEIPKILGARVETVALQFSPAGWFLDLEKLLQ